MKTKNLSTQAAFYFLGRASALLLSFSVPLVLVRYLDKNNFGVYSQALLLYTLTFKILQFGFRKSLFYFIPKRNSLQNYYLTNTVLFFTIVGAFGAINFYIFRNGIAQFFGNTQMVKLVPLVGIFIFFMLFSCSLEPTLVSQSKASKAGLVIFFSQIVRSISIIVPVMLYKTVSSALLGLVAYSIVRAFFLLIFVKITGGFVLNRKNWEYFKKQFSYSKHIGLSGILSNLSRRFDKLILSYYFSPEMFAIYKIGNFRIPFVQMFFMSIGEVMLPKAVSLLKSGKIEQFLAFWKRTILRFLFIGIGAFFILQLVAHDLIVILFTAKYVQSVPIFRIVLGYLLGSMLQYGIILRTTGDTNLILRSNIISFAVLVPITFFLTKYFSTIGAATAGLTGFYLNAFFQINYSIKTLRTNLRNLYPITEFLQLGLISLILFLVFFTLQGLIPSSILRIVSSLIGFTTAYIILSYKLNIYRIFDEILWSTFINKIKNYVPLLDN